MSRKAVMVVVDVQREAMAVACGLPLQVEDRRKRSSCWTGRRSAECVLHCMLFL